LASVEASATIGAGLDATSIISSYEITSSGSDAF